MKFHQTISSALIATTAALSLSATAQAANLNFGLNFSTNNQSIWDTGSGLNISDNRFIGVGPWSKSGGFSPRTIVDEKCFLGFCTPAIRTPGFTASTSGQIGLQSKLNLNSGTVDAFIPVDLFLTLPDQPVKAGETVTLKSGFSFGNGATFNTFSPRGSYDLDLIFKLAAGLDVSPGTAFDIGFNIDETTNLLSFNSDNLNFQAGGSLASLSARFPKVNTVGTASGSNTLTSSGQDTFINGSLDLDLIATSLLGLPPLEGGGSIDLGIAGSLGYNYNLLDATATAGLALLQNFSLTGTLPALLSLEDGSIVSFNVGDDVTITVPNNVSGPLDINALVNLTALFSNTTSLGLNVGIEVLAGKFGLDIPFIGSRSIGPLFQDRFDLFNPAFKLYNNKFNLAGFNQQSLAFQIPITSGGGNGGGGNGGGGNGGGGNGGGGGSARVPEPSSTAALIGIGLASLGFLRRQKQVKI